ncbi:hypothetical protein FBY41_4278 [Humibacillus xanthopallidus]|uniref:Uncharacterized protein n=1 Tax=Humibacillus xanthopallidus TaxID=412689 RepID=A0A543HGN8_9MICO|nr:hypothetical protein FBY41_4278 [Humibacillus xanthopallidus]
MRPGPSSAHGFARAGGVAGGQPSLAVLSFRNPVGEEVREFPLGQRVSAH